MAAAPPGEGPPERITGLDHVVLYVDEVCARSGFYSAVFDAPVVDGDSVRFPGGAIDLRPAVGDLDLVRDAPAAGTKDGRARVAEARP